MGFYLRDRAPFDVSGFALVAMGVFPTTFFFRMAYSESLFLCLCISVFCAISRRWPLLAVALLCGLATAVRPVGVALLPPLFWYAIQGANSQGEKLKRLCVATGIGGWGLIAYIAFQYFQFSEPFAFALTQENWRVRPPAAFSQKALSLLSWEPLWGVYLPHDHGYWRDVANEQNPWFSLAFANPIYFTGAVLLIAFGKWKGWLTTYEMLFCVPALAIPYYTRAYEMCMLSQGRFAAVVFPVYIVLGYLLSRLPSPVAYAVIAISGALMAAYAGRFALGQMLI